MTGPRLIHYRIVQEVTGSEYPYVQFGKPTEATYHFTKQVLKDRFEELYGSNIVQQPRVCVPI